MAGFTGPKVMFAGKKMYVWREDARGKLCLQPVSDEERIEMLAEIHHNRDRDAKRIALRKEGLSDKAIEEVLLKDLEDQKISSTEPIEASDV